MAKDLNKIHVPEHVMTLIIRRAANLTQKVMDDRKLIGQATWSHDEMKKFFDETVNIDVREYRRRTWEKQQRKRLALLKRDLAHKQVELEISAAIRKEAQRIEQERRKAHRLGRVTQSQRFGSKKPKGVARRSDMANQWGHNPYGDFYGRR